MKYYIQLRRLNTQNPLKCTDFDLCCYPLKHMISWKNWNCLKRILKLILIINKSILSAYQCPSVCISWNNQFMYIIYDLGILPHCGDGQSLKYILLYSYPIMKVTVVYVAIMYRHSHICINTMWNTCDCLSNV